MKVCTSKGCRNVVKVGKYCNTCKSRKYRNKYPVKYAYDTLRNNAKRRNKAFSLTLAQFTSFAQRVDYMAKKGIAATSMHIDRIIESEGYHENNIQPLQNADNIRKYLSYYWDEVNRKMVFDTKTRKDSKLDTPF